MLNSQFDLGNTILRQAKEITSSIKLHFPSTFQNHERVKLEIHQCIADVRMHRRKALDLLDTTCSIDALVCPPTLFIARYQSLLMID